MSGGGTGTNTEVQTLRTNQGLVPLTPAAIKAHGQEKSRFAVTCISGAALLLLIMIYGIARYNGADNQQLLTVIGTVFGLFVGLFSHRSA
jgi:hypothetical protein